jgi:sulfinoalanine decarboxylase/sulfinoalanine decarboxylase/aspartate 1-decarboxylase
MRETLSQFNQLVEDLLLDEKENPVSEPIPAQDLYERIDLSLQDEPLDKESFYPILKELVLSAPKTATRAFFNQLFGGRNEKAVLGELLSVMLNNSMYTYKAAGVMIGVEKTIIRSVLDMIGWGEQANGTFAAGGSMTNFMSMLMARDAVGSNVTTKGVREKMTVYTSTESHYSIPKNATFSGIGREQVRYIPTNELGQMEPDLLSEEIQKDLKNGYLPVMVNATAGTTVLGAFDPISDLSVICKEYNIWLHVDGAYCGSVLFSKNYRHLIEGIEAVDSFSINAHKMLGTPLSSSMIFVKNKKHLYESFSNDANYLYQTDHDELNLGKISLQCGRRNDALKFWTLWKQIGTSGLEKMVDKQFELADVARTYIAQNDDYTLYSFEDSVGICFNYKDFPAKDICTLLYEKATLMVGYGHFRQDEFIRLVTINAQNEKEDIVNFFRTLESFVEKHKEELLAMALPEQ